ncbi:MAG TPA: hypothetical protein VI583_04330 [Cyclobacteriaceae bacterium]|nr:hypothetical protein [Cyclobacteriaceae bacterium]
MIDEGNHLNEDIRAGLVKKFYMDTSPDFTAKVMRDINVARNAQRTFRKVLLVAMISVFCIGLIVFTGNQSQLSLETLNPSPVFGFIQKLIFSLKPGLVLMIIFSVSTTIFIDSLMKRLTGKKIQNHQP